MGCSSTGNQRQELENQTLETILNRKAYVSIRITGRKGKDRQTDTKAGMAAPSSRDRRPWEFIIVTDRKALIRWPKAFPSPDAARDKASRSSFAAIRSNPQRFRFLDCSAASQNLATCRRIHGIGSRMDGCLPLSGPDRDRPERASVTRSYHTVERHTCGIPHAERDSQKQIQRPTDPSQRLVKLYDFQITPSVSRPVHPDLHGNTFRHFLYVRDNADLAPLRTQALKGIHSDPQRLPHPKSRSPSSINKLSTFIRFEESEDKPNAKASETKKDSPPEGYARYGSRRTYLGRSPAKQGIRHTLQPVTPG